MKILILGASGMLGHKLLEVLNKNFEVIGTFRKFHNEIQNYPPFKESQLVFNVDAMDFSSVKNVISQHKPNVIVNCIGIIKQIKEAKNAITSIAINSLFPHQLEEICQSENIRLIHFSTDCVFSGIQGNYTEQSIPDPEDLYGRSKLLGELTGENSLTIRTSIIGRELREYRSLVEWLLNNQDGRVFGYSYAIFSGFPTIILANIISNVIKNHKDLSGLWHVSSDPISKYDLLVLLNEAFETNIEISENTSFHCKRNLNSQLFRDRINYTPPPWSEMVAEMVADSREYSKLKH
ncbi:MAG: SDR family oxidoreductase [Methylocystaceae bacterium]|nr:SDR family oxidoreductase [Methylocystaceae bacterium]